MRALWGENDIKGIDSLKGASLFQEDLETR